MASKQAGNTGVRNEIVSIFDELLRRKILPHDAYKNLMLTLNKWSLWEKDINENAKSVALGFFQSSKTFCQDSSKQVVHTTLNIARSAGQKAGQKAIDFACSKLTPKSQQILSKLVSSTPPLAPQRTTPQKAQQVTTNLNNLIAGSGHRAIKIQDLVRRLNKQ